MTTRTDEDARQLRAALRGIQQTVEHVLSSSAQDMCDRDRDRWYFEMIGRICTGALAATRAPAGRD